MDTLFVSVLLCFLVAGTSGLRCYKCVDVEVKSGSSVLKSMLDGHTDPECGNPSVLDQASSTTCSSGQECGLVESSVTASVLLMGDVIFKIQARDCMGPPETITGPKCYDDDNQVLGIVKGIINLFLSLSYDMTVDGRVCYCTTDLCAAGGCGDGKVGILGYCMEWYYWALVGLGGIVSLFLLTCCCCCCCCCKSKKQGGVVHHVPVAQPQAVIVTTSHGIAGIENPGYGQAAYVPMIQK